MTRTIATFIGIAVGAVFGVALAATGASPAFILVLVVPALAFLFFCKVYVPRRGAYLIRRQLKKAVDPTATAPAGAAAADNELIRRVVAARDLEGRDALLSADFTMVDVRGRRHKRVIYERSAVLMERLFPQLDHGIEEILADPDEPGVFHVRERTVGRAHTGPDMDYTSWERYVLTPCGTQIRAIEVTAIVAVA